MESTEQKNSEGKMDELFTEESGESLLTFLLDTREYAIRIIYAREVIGIHHIDAVPLTPNYVKGVINLRGKIIPIIDLRLKFGIQEKKFTKESCIIVIEYHSQLTGFIVDQLIGVLGFNKEDYEEAPYLGRNINTDYLEGMVKSENRVIIVLNCEMILTNLDSNQIESIKTETIEKEISN
jgi:purine-binding chemotaxis protein CheW